MSSKTAAKPPVKKGATGDSKIRSSKSKPRAPSQKQDKRSSSKDAVSEPNEDSKPKQSSSKKPKKEKKEKDLGLLTEESRQELDQ
jgi:hypothetical protein